MAFARDSYTAGAAQTDYTITFGYLEEDHVTVYEDGVLQTEGGSNDYTIVSGVTVRFNSGHAGGEVILLIRSTSQSSRLVDYANASTITESDLDNDSLQAFYMCQEAIDSVATGMGLNVSDQWDGESKKIQDVADPTLAQDAATQNYVDSVLVSLGNVPDPLAGETGYVLAATGAGAWDWTDKTPTLSRYTYVATAAQTSFTGADANGNTMAFTSAGLFGVWLNGVLLRPGAGFDYTTTSTTTITLVSGANLNDVLEVVTFNDSLVLADAISQTTADARYLQLTDDLETLLGFGTQGDLLYYNGTDWVALAAGTSGYHLKTQGAGANPAWDDLSSSLPGRTGGTTDLTNAGADDLTEVDISISDADLNWFMFSVFAASQSALNNPIGLRLGTSGGIKSTGYNCKGTTHGNATDDYTTGFFTGDATFSDSGDTIDHSFQLRRMYDDVWQFHGNLHVDGDGNQSAGWGWIDLADTLTTVRITTLNGTATLDGGTDARYGYGR
jgi:hypothetical protein